MKEKTVTLKVKDGLGTVGVRTTGYDREFEPGRTYEVTEQEYDLYLKQVESLETTTESALDTGKGKTVSPRAGVKGEKED